MNILVTGGAGYIGSACVRALIAAKHAVTVVDNLSTGRRELVPPRAEFVEASVLDKIALHNVMRSKQFDCVIHLAGHKQVGESMQQAGKYSENITGTINVLDAMVEYKVPKIIFSSTAVVYGELQTPPFAETLSPAPSNYYGATKWVDEQLMYWYQQIHGVQYVVLRYFNAAGDSGISYRDMQPSNLFPVIQAVIAGDKSELIVFGTDYDTPDGTCIRDYIHIDDIVSAHIKALHYDKSNIFNIGTGHGASVLEVITEFEKQLGAEIPKKMADRRPGDSAVLIADSTKAQTELDWKPEKTLPEMVTSCLFVADDFNSV